MKTAVECCDYCERLGNIPKTKKWKPAEKDFTIAIGLLSPDEDVLLAFNAFLNWKSVTKNDGLFSVAVTNRRIIMAQKIAFSEDVKQINIEKIIDASFASNSPVMNLATITLRLANGEYGFSMDAKSAPSVYGALQEVL